MIEIRDVDEADHSAIWAMLEPVFRAGETYAIDPAISREDALSYWHSGHAFLAGIDGRAAGTFYIRANQGGGGAHVCNCGFITAQGAEGQGVARAMLAFALDKAKALGFEAMQFNFVLANNTRAVATWEKAGFEVIGCQPKAFRMPDGDYVDALMMHRVL